MTTPEINPTSSRPGALLRVLLGPMVLAGGLLSYVVVAGSTGFCPICSGIMNTVTGGAIGGAGRADAVDAASMAAAVPSSEPGAFSQLTFHSVDGTPVAMSDYLGKQLLIEVWATWCAPCRRNRAILAKAQEQLGGHASLVALSVDQGGAPVVKQFLDREAKGDSQWVELLATDPDFRGVIKPHDRRPTIPKLIYVSANGSVVDIEYGEVDPDWIENRLKAMAPPGSVGG